MLAGPVALVGASPKTFDEPEDATDRQSRLARTATGGRDVQRFVLAPVHRRQISLPRVGDDRGTCGDVRRDDSAQRVRRRFLDDDHTGLSSVAKHARASATQPG